MRNWKKVLLFVSTVAISLGMAQSSQAATATLSTDIASAYVWRGVTVSDGLVLQPSLDVSGLGNFTINAWGNLDLDDDNGSSGDFSEVDLAVTYSVPVDGWTLDIGLIEYLFPDGSGSTREITGQAGLSLSDSLSVGALLAYDIEEIDDIYACLSATHEQDVSDALSLALTAKAGYAGDETSANGDAGFAEYDISLAASYAQSESVSLGAFVALTDSIDDDVLAEQDVDVYGGVSVSVDF